MSLRLAVLVLGLVALAQAVNDYTPDLNRAPTVLSRIGRTAGQGVANAVASFIVYSTPAVDGIYIGTGDGYYEDLAYKRCPVLRSFSCGTETGSTATCTITQATETVTFKLFTNGGQTQQHTRPQVGTVLNFPINTASGTGGTNGAYYFNPNNAAQNNNVPSANFITCSLTVTLQAGFKGDHVTAVFSSMGTTMFAQTVVIPVDTV